MSRAIFRIASASKRETPHPRYFGRARRRLIKPLTAVTLLLAIISTAPTLAYGDANGDAAFVAALDSAGFTYEAVPRVISVGHGMCYFADEGKQENELVSILQENNAALTAERARQFVAIALEAYCPQDLGQVSLTSIQDEHGGGVGGKDS